MKPKPPRYSNEVAAGRDQHPPIEFRVRSFDELSNSELHDLARLRVEVFVVEQKCLYPEFDGRDPEASHLLGHEAGELVAYARWYRQGNAAVLGRILTRADRRHRGLGRALMAEAISAIGSQEIRISAQRQLEDFYRELGFETVSPPYDDFGIPHVDMVRSANYRPS